MTARTSLLCGALLAALCSCALAAANIHPNNNASLVLQLAVDGLDGSYVLHVGGKPWLHSGALRFFVNGEWHGLQTTKQPEPSPICGASDKL